MPDDTTNPDPNLAGEDGAATLPAEPQNAAPADAGDALPTEPVSDVVPADVPAEVTPDEPTADPGDVVSAAPADATPTPLAGDATALSAAPAAESVPEADGGLASNMIDQAELDALAGQLSGLKDDSPGPLPAATDADPPVMDDAIARAMAEAIAAESAAAGSAAPADAAPGAAEPAGVGATTVRVSADQAQGFTPPELPTAEAESATTIDMLDDVQLDVKIELGRTNMYIEDVLKLGAGSVVELDKLAGDPVDIYVNDLLIARGEVLVLNDNFCVRINAIHSSVGELERA